MAVQLQWDLSQTSTSVIGVAAGVLRAATTDNVQPLVIMACEQFGNTLAMSPDTVRKIEHSVVPAPPPPVLAFLKSSIGYSANDCTSHFGKNVAGLQFLALAAALATSMGAAKAATATQAMLASTARDKTLLPSIRQVRDLYNSLEPRCHRSGFVDDVAGWNMLLNPSGPKLPDGSLVDSRYSGISYFPEPQGIGDLVDALRQLRRIGDADITKVMIRANKCAPWAIAFVKWSLGYPPSVVESDGNPILQHADSNVIVVIMRHDRDRETFQVTVHSSINGPSDLVPSRADQVVAGMVSLKTYGNLLLRNYGFDNTLGARAFQEAMPHVLQQTVERMSFSAGTLRHRSNSSSLETKRLDNPRVSARKEAREPKLSPFPLDHVISTMVALLFDQELDLGDLPDITLLTDLPAVAIHIGDLRKRSRHNQRREDAMLSNYLQDLSVIVADVLALSLFDCPELLRVSNALAHPYRNDSNEFVRGVYENLRNGYSTDIDIAALWKMAMQLVGHDKGPTVRGEPIVLSSFKGQTVWPTVYEMQGYAKRGYLSLSWLPGRIIHRGNYYSRAVGQSEPQLAADHLTQTCQERVLGPRNLCPEMELEWNVTPGDDGTEDYLFVSVGVRDPLRRYSSVATCPSDALTTLARAIIVEDCGHDPDTNLNMPELSCVFTGPVEPVKTTARSRSWSASRVGISPVSSLGAIDPNQDPM